jgi:tetratricopeptide (TPR) repeat protein
VRYLDLFDRALEHAKRGQFEDAKYIFEELLKEDPEDSNLLYNLGMCYTELGKPIKAIELLKQSIQYNPAFSNAYVALGVAYSKVSDLKNAKYYLLKSIEWSPDNSYALKNLGGVFAKEEDYIKAVYYLKRSFEINPHDPFTVYGLGLTYNELGDYVESEKYFKIFIHMDAPESLNEEVKAYLTRIAEKELKSKGFRLDAVFYMLNALKLFKTKPFQEIHMISSEIGLKGQKGLDINDPSKKYKLNSIEGEFTGFELLCMMYVGFKNIAPNLEVGIDLSEEYDTAISMFNSEEIL